MIDGFFILCGALDDYIDDVGTGVGRSGKVCDTAECGSVRINHDSH